MRKVIAFTLETIGEPKYKGAGMGLGDDIPGIACAATFPSDDEEPKLWYHGYMDGSPLPGEMDLEEARDLVLYLCHKYDDGYIPVTWDGLRSDFRILSKASRMHNTCVQLSMKHIDMLFHFFCSKGYVVKLSSVLDALTEKLDIETDGNVVPNLWVCSHDDRLKAMKIVFRNAEMLLRLYELTSEHEVLSWITRSKKYGVMYLHEGWKQVYDNLLLPEPDVSWMENPMSRESFFGWWNYD